MSVVNPLAREISAKIVFYGPGLSGKTTSLKHIHASVKPQRRGELVTLATEGDRTIFFDFLPLSVRQVRGMGVRFQLYTVPGQVYYEATRRLVLAGADGVIFVADSRPAAHPGNLEALADLQRNLEDEDIDIEKFPIVFQYNKRDLPDAMSREDMDAELNWLGVPAFLTQATSGEGVLDALKEASKGVIRSLWGRFGETPTTRAVVTQMPADEGIAAELQRASDAASAASEPAAPDPAPDASPEEAQSAGSALSFAGLWEGEDAIAVARVEDAIRAGDHGEAVATAARAMAELFDALPGTGDPSPMAKATLLGLDGREFLRFCRLAGSQPENARTEDALFGLYMLVSARLKASRV